jgi:hypothetical protein
MLDFDAQDLGVGAMRILRYQADTMILAAQATIPTREKQNYNLRFKLLFASSYCLTDFSKPFGTFLVSSEPWGFRCTYN